MMPPSSLAVPEVTEMSDRFTLFSYFMPHFTSSFTSPFSGTLRAVKELWLEEVQVVGQAVAADSRCWLLAQFEVVMLTFEGC